MAWQRPGCERARLGLGELSAGPLVAVALAACAIGACRQTVLLDPLALEDAGMGPNVEAHPDGDGAGGGHGNGGGSGNSGGGNNGGGRDAGGRPDGADFCFGGQIQKIPITMRTPDIILSVDRSSSMQSWFGSNTKLQVVQEQIRALVGKYRRVFFGYEEFPSTMGMCSNGQGCCAGAVTLPTFNNLKAIQSAISACDGNGPGCNQTQRPVADALSKCYSTYGNLFSPTDTGHRYVALFLAGDPSCMGSDPTSSPCDDAVEQVTKLSRSFTNTAVFGVGDDTAGSACLDQLALYGGLSSGTASPLYHLAKTPTDLSGALDPVVETIAEEACTIDVRSPPADPSKVSLLFDGVPVPNDPVDGWTFDEDTSLTLTVHGTYCRTLVQTTNQVDLVTGCPVPHN